MKRIIITSFSDPLCVWCWASEPVFRALETRYPMDIEVRQVMGGMIRDIQDLDPSAKGNEEDLLRVNREMGAQWLANSGRHHMPVAADAPRLFDLSSQSSYPQGRAYKAAQIADPKKAGRFLRLLREASVARGLPTGSPAVIQDLVKEAGIDIQRFQQAMTDGSAQSAFQADLGLTQAVGVQAFPTFLIKSSQARQMMMRGFMSAKDFHRAIAQLTDKDLKPLPSPPDADILLWLIEEQGSLTPEEVYQAFDFAGRDEAERWLSALIKDHVIRKEPLGNGHILRA